MRRLAQRSHDSGTMKENVGRSDQLLRFALAPALAGYALSRARQNALSALVAAAGSAAVFESALSRTCPLNALFRRDTRSLLERRPGAMGAAAVAAIGATALAARALVRARRSIPLRGRTVIVTGGTRGLGFATARAFAREGCKVAICARDAAELVRAHEELRQAGAEDVLALRCDVSNKGEVETFVREVTAHFGPIDVLVNNASEILVGPLSATTDADLERMFQSIFWTVYHPTMAVLPDMRARGFGRIVNVTSVGGKSPLPHVGAYAAPKFAATAFSETLAAEVAGDGVCVTTITPPPMRNASHVNATYKGDPTREFIWFAGGLANPFTSIDPERAVRTIVRAAKEGFAESAVAPSAWLLARIHGLSPNLSAALFRLASRLMPNEVAPSEAETRKGSDIERESDSKAVQFIRVATAPSGAEYRQTHKP